MTDRHAQLLSEIGATPTFRTVDGVSTWRRSRAIDSRNRSGMCSRTRRSSKHSEMCCCRYRRRCRSFPAGEMRSCRYLDQRLPHSQLHVIDAGHFIWEDAADEYAAVVSAWWTDGFKRCTTKSTHLLQEELR